LSQRILRLANLDVCYGDFLHLIAGTLRDFFDCAAVEVLVQQEQRCFRCKVAGKRQTSGNATQLSTWEIPLVVADENVGAVLLEGSTKSRISAAEQAYFDNVVQTLGLALINQWAHSSLRERVKELTCLYSISQLAEQPNTLLPELFRGIVKLLPPAWQYPEVAVARLLFDGESYATAEDCACPWRQTAEIVVRQQWRGRIEVGYTEERPPMDEGPFLHEERSLLEAVARQISLLVERREAAEDRGRLQVQLRHADRLATIGQLSAGVAHELNEPLGNILAFAQLAAKHPDLPPQIARDLEKIVTTSLHAREIIKKLMLFARRTPPQKTAVNLNTLVKEGLFFLESRCQKEGVRVELQLAPDLPKITADPSQLNQVLVNLVVNAIQAMPSGGLLKISTLNLGNQVALCVEDNGVGMSARVLKKIFVPFFTTKDIHEGTGLGLSVVHGIVTAHGGTIHVSSTPGQGSRFEIRLPLHAADSQEEGPRRELDA